MDLVDGNSLGAHLKGFADAVGEFRIWHPAVILTLLACARIDGGHWLAFEAAWWDAWHGSLGNDGAEAVFCIDGGLAALFFVGDVNQDLDEAAIGTLRDVVCEGVDDDAALGTQEGFVIGGVIEITGEAGVIPEQDGCGTIIFTAGGCDHAVEFIAACSGAA